MFGFRVMDWLPLFLAAFVIPVAPCPDMCDCGHAQTVDGESRLDIHCFVNDLRDLDFLSLVELRTNMTVSIKCKSSIPVDLADHMFGFNRNLISLSLSHCKLSYVKKQAFYGLSGLEGLSIHDASSYHLQLHPESMEHAANLRSLSLTGSGILKLPNLCKLMDLQFLNISGNDLISLPIAGLECLANNLPNLSAIDISSNNFPILNDFLNYGDAFTNLESIYAKNNKIHLERSVNVLSKLSKLRILDLSENNITVLPEAFLNKCENLQDLDLGGNGLTELSSDLFDNTRKLLVLNLRENNLGDSVWSSLPPTTGLHVLDVSGNKLTSLNRTTLLRLPDIMKLHLAGNLISEIPEGAFLGSPRLSTLDLSRNKLHVVGPHVLDGLIGLFRLNLQDNAIYSIDSDAFVQLKNVKVLNVSYNYNLRELPSLKMMGALEIFDASYNQIDQLAKTAFVSQVNVGEINLSHNRLEQIPDSIFSTCNLLERLDLSNNRIHFVHPSAFMNLGLKTLNLQGNKIETIGKTFAFTSKLQELNLSNNAISDTLQKNMFPDNIEMLDLSFNKIQTIRPYAFDELKQIRIIDLRFNYISTLPEEALQTSTRQFSQTGFVLSNNPLSCDCNLLWLRRWDQRIKGPHIVNLNATSCTAPASLAGRLLMEVPHDSFLCEYSSICQPSCPCCAFSACDCRNRCPEHCTCFHSADLTSTHKIMCNNANVTTVSLALPRIATHVDYGGSAIERIPTNAFVLMKNLETLMLNNTQLSGLEPLVFSDLVELKKLYLNNNKLTVLDPGVFRGLDSLHSLDLSHNDITVASITDDVMRDLTNMQTLDLSYNQIHRMNNYLSKLAFSYDMNLANNKWVCDCILYFTARERPRTFIFTRQKRSAVPDIHCLDEENLNASISLPQYSWRCDYRVNTVNPEHGKPEMIKNESFQGDVGIRPVHSDVTGKPINAADLYTLKLVLPAAIAAVLVIIVVLLIACRKDIVKCWLFKCKPHRFEHIYDKFRYYDAFVAYDPQDKNTVEKMATQLEKKRPGIRLTLQHRDRPAEAAPLPFIDACVKSSCRTIIVLSPSFVEDNTLLKCITQCVSQDSLNRTVIVFLGQISQSKIDPVLLTLLRKGRCLHFGEPWFWEKLIFSLPEIRGSDRDACKAEVRPYTSSHVVGTLPVEGTLDNRGYEEVPTDYNLPSSSGYGYGLDSSDGNIYEEIKDPTAFQYSVPWSDSELEENVNTLTRSSQPQTT